MQPPPLPSQALRNTFPEIDDKKLKSLYSDHRSINAISALWILGSIIFLLVGMMVAISRRPEVDPAINYIEGSAFIGFGLLYFAFIIAIYRRVKWARIAGIVWCIICLFGFPLGTILGILGLMAFIRSPELFGKDRLDPDEIKVEYNYRKKNRKALRGGN